MFSNPSTLKRIGIGIAVVVLGVLLFLRIAAVPEIDPERNRGGGDDPLEKARSTLRRSSDLAACRAALGQLNALLGQKRDVKLPTLSVEERDALVRELKLTQDEVAELNKPNFTLLDGIHLESALLFRDAARSVVPKVDASPRTPEQQAAAVFAWVVRQIQIVGDEPLVGKEPMFPPQLALRRGLGVPISRALVFLGLLEQLELDGCLMAFPPGDGKSPIRYWACGVRGSKDRIYLFDPALGLPFPGPEGKGIATLDELTDKDTPILSQLGFGLDGRVALTPEAVAEAEVHLVVPLSSVAPRMRYLEKEVVNLAGGGRVAAKSEREDRFRAALKAINHAGTVGVAPWSVRVQRSFYPPNEGGGADAPMLSQFRTDLVRQNILPLLNAIPASIQDKFMELPLSRRFIEVYGNRIEEFFLGPGKPRDLQLRGDLNEAMRALSTTEQQLEVAEDSFQRNYDPKQVEQWYDLAFAVAAGRKDARETKGTEKMVILMIEGSSAESLRPHVAYLLSLVKHEEVERLQYRLGPVESLVEKKDLAAIRELEQGWEQVRNVWNQYLFNHSLNQAHGKALQARGQHMLAEAAWARAQIDNTSKRSSLEEHARSEVRKAIDYWEDMAKDRKDSPAIGYRVLARQLKEWK